MPASIPVHLQPMVKVGVLSCPWFGVRIVFFAHMDVSDFECEPVFLRYKGPSLSRRGCLPALPPLGPSLTPCGSLTKMAQLYLEIFPPRRPSCVSLYG